MKTKTEALLSSNIETVSHSNKRLLRSVVSGVITTCMSDTGYINVLKI